MCVQIQSSSASRGGRMFRQFALLTLGLAVMVVDAMDKYQGGMLYSSIVIQ